MVLGLALAALGALVAPSTVLAQDDEGCGLHFGDLILTDGQNLTCDVVVVGGSVLVEAGARIDGSLNVMPGSARVDGEVTGDVSAANALAVGGTIGGNAFAIGGDVEVAGDVARNATAARGRIELAQGASVGGRVSARGDVVLGPGSSVGEAVVAGEDVEMDASAQVGGSIDEGHVPSGSASAAGLADGTLGQSGPFERVLLVIAVIVLGALFAALTAAAVPNAVANVADAAGASPFLMILLGALSLVVSVFASLLIVTIPLMVLALAMGWVGLSHSWGRKLHPGGGRGGQTFLGGLLVMSLGVILLLGMVLAPELTWLRTCGLGLLLIALVCWAYGAGLATLFGRRRHGASEGDAGSEPPPAEEPTVEGGFEPVVDPPMVQPVEAPIDAPGWTPDSGAEPALSPGEPALPEISLEPPPPPQPPPVAAGLELRQVVGLSPIYAELLRSAGVHDAAQLAHLSPEDVSRLTAAPGVMPVGLERAGAWIQAARKLLDGTV